MLCKRRIAFSDLILAAATLGAVSGAYAQNLSDGNTGAVNTPGINQAFMGNLQVARQGNAVAENNLGNFYIRGQGTPKDYGQAFYWYQQAAQQGLADAQANLADMYSEGTGTQQDYTQAFNWYQKAAVQGNAGAQQSLGDLYARGVGIKQDYAQ
ncbi:MAG TPA: tetratricopeptide repeat protein, partial [Phycisphaerae bacterium]|nr:tetratricopeptide repeat protein [Phycisphaerae bacterium]